MYKTCLDLYNNKLFIYQNDSEFFLIIVIDEGIAEYLYTRSCLAWILLNLSFRAGCWPYETYIEIKHYKRDGQLDGIVNNTATVFSTWEVISLHLCKFVSLF